MKKLKVLIFNPKVTASGISKILSDYINNFSDGINTEIMTLEVNNDIYYQKNKIKINIIGKTKNIFKRIYREYRIMKKGNYDVIHINGEYVIRIIECFVAKIAGIKKIIIHSHNDGVGSNKRSKVIIHKILKKLFDYFATDYLACSNNAAKWMFSNKIFNNNKFEIINNGIDINKYIYNEIKREEIRKKHNIENKYVVGFVGRLSYQKNPLFLIEVFNEYKNKNEKAFLIIIGTGELENEVKRKIKQLGIVDSVLFLKNINNVYDYYNAMDCFILPSLYEGFGIVNIEAQSSGLPTFVSNNVPKEAKISNLIKYIDLDKGAQYWANIIIKTEIFDRKNAYKFAIEKDFDIKDVTKKLENIYYQK